MTIKVPVSEITMGTQQGNAIVDVHTVEVLGRLSLSAARDMYPDYVVIGIERHFSDREVDQTALEQLIDYAPVETVEPATDIAD